MTKVYERQLATSRHHSQVLAEMQKAIDKFPLWPSDMLHAVTIVGEEYGELLKDVLQFHYEPHKGKNKESIRAEAIQTIAMLHRFLNSLDTDRYNQVNTIQHEYPA